jgi:hypothetical protein
MELTTSLCRFYTSFMGRLFEWVRLCSESAGAVPDDLDVLIAQTRWNREMCNLHMRLETNYVGFGMCGCECVVFPDCDCLHDGM